MKTGEGAVAYVRVSDQRQADSFNLEKQQAMLGELAELKHAVIERVFVDPGESAHINADRRPQFCEMMRYLEESNRAHGGCIRYAFFATESRLSRDIFHALDVAFKKLPELGVEPVFANTPHLDLTSAAGKQQLVQSFTKAWGESLEKREVAEKAWQSATQRGRWPSQAPVGYLNISGKTGSNIVPDPMRAPYITRGFELVAQFQPPKQALKVLTQNGLRSKSGRKVNLATWYKVLRNPLYMGYVRYRPHNAGQSSEVMRGLHQSLVSEPLFRHVQDILDGSKRRRGKRVPNPDFPFQARCVCGTKLTGNSTRSKTGRRYAYYSCPRCGAHHPKAKIEQQVTDLVLAPFLNNEFKNRWLEHAADFYVRHCGSMERQQRDMQARRVKLEEQKQRTVSLIISASDDELRQEYEQALLDLRAELRRTDSDIASLFEEKGKREDWLSFAEQVYTADLPNLWALCSPAERERVRSLLFSGDVFFFEDGRISNSQTPCLYSVLVESAEETKKWCALRDSNSRPSGS